jgi:hypothetical protein
MADQHNSNIPAMGNQISADIPDIKENLEFHKDAFQVIFQSWTIPPLYFLMEHIPTRFRPMA